MHQIMYNEYPVTWKLQQITDDVSNFIAHNGDRYGTNSVRIPTEKVFDTYDEAREYIQSVDNRDYDGIAVKYLDYSGLEPTAKAKGYMAKIAELRNKRVEYEREHSVHKQKSEFIGCRDCGSKLRNSRFKAERCPVCGSDLRSSTTLNRIASFDARIEELFKKISDEEKKQKAKATTKWLVKFEYHC